MDRDVTVRFYEIEHVGNGRTFAEILAHVQTLPLAEREAFVGDDLKLRLEQATNVQGGLIVGDITRVQTNNLPSHPTHRASDPLPIDRLGHHTAFCYDPASRIIALQFDMKMAAGRLCRYGNIFGEGTKFSPFPVLREDALERFEQETPTKFRVRVAKVHQFTQGIEQPTDFENAIEEMGTLFSAPMVEVVVSARGVDGGLDRVEVLAIIRRWLGLREQFPGIRTISAETDESTDPFNFIKHLLKHMETLELPDNDPTAGRAARIGFVRRCFDDHRAYLRAAYAEPAA